MNKNKVILNVGLILIGLVAFFTAPRLFKFEPVINFRLGVGALIAIVAMFAIFGLQLVQLGSWYEQKRSRVALNKAQNDHEQAHWQFIRRLDHEMKNPLTGLQVELANLQEISDEVDKHQAIENALRALERISHLLHDLRKLSELDKQSIERRPIDVTKLVNEMVSAVTCLPENQKRKINVLVSQIPSPFPMFFGDWDLLGLAIYNVLDNAFKFTANQDAIEVRVREDGHSIFIEVADSGLGILGEESSQIFEDLYRGSNAQGVEGSGLGLSLVKRIVSLHGGRISVRSQQGQPHATIFTISLPV